MSLRHNPARIISSPLFLLTGLLVCTTMAAAETLYPEIEELNRDDPLFLQAISDIDEYYHRSQSGGEIPPLTIFSYRPEDEETLFTVSARFNLPYETIALLNSFSGPEDLATAGEILVPNMPGIFVYPEPETDLEKLMVSWRYDFEEKGTPVVVRTPGEGRRTLYFLPGERFHSVERAFFLQVLFRFPLPDGIITSRYGIRRSPFTRKVHFHHGIDIAAPAGTDVYASWRGDVERIGISNVLGRYIVISHSNGFRTIYGHLEKISVKRGTAIGTGTIIGSVGNTGLSTGPHLHFEIRKAGESWDPATMLR